MRIETQKGSVVAWRGFERSGYVPTMFTEPRLRTRRYSVDVYSKKDVTEKAGKKKQDVEDIKIEVCLSCKHDCQLHSDSTLTFAGPSSYH